MIQAKTRSKNIKSAKRSNDLLDKLPEPGSKPPVTIESVVVAGGTTYRIVDFRAFTIHEDYGDQYPSVGLDRNLPALVSRDRGALRELKARMENRAVYILDPERAKFAPDLLSAIPHVDRPRFNRPNSTKARLYIVPNQVEFTRLSNALDERFALTPDQAAYFQSMISRGVITDERAKELFNLSSAELTCALDTGSVTHSMLAAAERLERPPSESALEELREMFDSGRLTPRNCGFTVEQTEALCAHDAYKLARQGALTTSTRERMLLQSYHEHGLVDLSEDEVTELASEQTPLRTFTSIVRFRGSNAGRSLDDAGADQTIADESPTDPMEAFEQVHRTGLYMKPHSEAERRHNALERLHDTIRAITRDHEKRMNLQLDRAGVKADDERRKDAFLAVEHLPLPAERRAILHVRGAEYPFVFGLDRQTNGFIVNVKDAAMLDADTRHLLFSRRDQNERERDGRQNHANVLQGTYLRIEPGSGTQRGARKSYVCALSSQSFEAAEAEADAIAELHLHRWTTGLQDQHVTTGTLEQGEIFARNDHFSVLYDGNHTICVVPNHRLPVDARIYEPTRVISEAPVQRAKARSR